MKRKNLRHFTVLGIFGILSCLLFSGILQANDFTWPPKIAEPYPDLQLIDQTGKTVKLSSFKGKVILLEPLGMTCPACQALWQNSCRLSARSKLIRISPP